MLSQSLPTAKERTNEQTNIAALQAASFVPNPRSLLYFSRVNMTPLRAFLLLWALSATSAFVAPIQKPNPTFLKLHPNQAADLEAFAYDLMKEAAAAASAEQGGEDKMHHHDERHHHGPIAWCKRVWNGNKQHRGNNRKRGRGRMSSTAVHANKNLKP